MSYSFMTPYIVCQGDHLAKLAHRFGFNAAEVWNHERNRELRELRSDSTILCPGDVLYIPKSTPTPLTLRAGQLNVFTVSVPELNIAVKIAGDDGPWANEVYVVENLTPVLEGATDGDGLLALSLPIGTASVRVFFPQRNHCHELLVGHLDPVSERSGIVQRLSALGYLDPTLDDESGDGLALALLRFQEDHGLNPTGILDDQTTGALVTSYGA